MTDDQIKDMTEQTIELYTRMLQSLPNQLPTVPIMATLCRLTADMCIVMVGEAKDMNLSHIPSMEELVLNFSKDLLEMAMDRDQIAPRD